MCLKPSNPLGEREAGAHRTLGIFLMRLRIAEIAQHAVAHIFGDKAAQTGDLLSDRRMVGADHLAQVLGVKPRRQRGRADQIAEHDGQLPPLGTRPHPSLPRMRGRVRVRAVVVGSRWPGERGDRIQQLAAVPDCEDTDVLEIVCRQARQHRPIDGVRSESIDILRQVQLTQPIGNIHGGASDPPLAGKQAYAACRVG